VNDVIEDWISGFGGHSAVLVAVMKFSASDIIFLAPLLLAALWLWPVEARQRAFNQRIAFVAAVGGVLALLLAAGVAHLHSDARPFVTDASARLLIPHAADSGFPSEHTTLAFAIGSAIVWWRRSLGLITLAFAALVGISRVYVGVHWPVDVAAGALVGAVAGSVAARSQPYLAGLQRRISEVLPSILVSSP
jgi:undecaprenyl-diphosphatase